MKRRESIKGPGGIMIVLDAKEIFPSDPGNGTPAMVYLPFGRGHATYWCAQGEGYVEDDKYGTTELTDAQKEWINSDSIENAVSNWIRIRSDAIERDGRDAVLSVLK